jgi:regulator of protease activity HflC (stomatin/prohibitin superfamily)
MTEKLYIQVGTEKQEAKGEQLDYLLQAQADAKQTQLKIEAEQEAKQIARESALEKLSSLGLTEDEIAALIS